MERERESYDDRFDLPPTPHSEDIRDRNRGPYRQRGGPLPPEPYERNRRGPPPDRYDRDKRGPLEGYGRDKHGPMLDVFDRERYPRERDRYGSRDQRPDLRDSRYEGKNF